MLPKIYRILIFPYTIFLVYLMLLGFGRTQMEDNIARLEPFFSVVNYSRQMLEREEYYSLAINLIGNVVMFIPFGFLGWVFPKLANFKNLMYDFLSAIIIVEALQYFTRMGVLELDDIILNSIGVCIGYWIFRRYFWGAERQLKA